MRKRLAQRALVYYTANAIRDSFGNSVRNHLLNLAVTTDSFLISVSQKPLPDFGLNICIGELGRSVWLVYWQILKGAQAAQQLGIPWLCCCEDDSLYTEAHLTWEPPRADRFYYNMNRWIVELEDKKARYRWRDRVSMCSCVVSTDLMVETLEARFKKYPDMITTRYDPRSRGWGEPGRYEWYLKLPRVGKTFFVTEQPILTFNHKLGLGGLRKPSIKDIMEVALFPWGDAQTMWDTHHG